jgi:hypothetical protein
LIIPQIKRIVDWFDQNCSKTPKGYKAYAIAISKIAPNSPKAALAIKAGWIYGDFSPPEAKAFLKHNKAIITHLDHAKKIDYLLWSGERSVAKQFAATLTNKERALHDAISCLFE